MASQTKRKEFEVVETGENKEVSGWPLRRAY